MWTFFVIDFQHVTLESVYGINNQYIAATWNQSDASVPEPQSGLAPIHGYRCHGHRLETQTRRVI